MSCKTCLILAEQELGKSLDCFKHSTQAQIEILSWLLENASGGGSWRRIASQKIEELSTHISQ